MSKEFTRKEVESTAGTEKTLIILHDKVYDVSRFLNEHPGGEEILVDHAGKDGSEDFDDVGHSKDAFDMMKNYMVGELVESEKTNKKPKEGWSISYNKQQPSSKKEESIHPLLLTGIIGIFAIIIYYLYL